MANLLKDPVAVASVRARMAARQKKPTSIVSLARVTVEMPSPSPAWHNERIRYAQTNTSSDVYVRVMGDTARRSLGASQKPRLR
ncbi:MAG: hypothetical protein Q7S57_06105 [bacterium]|nr:hypothetical protein [bacterium]